jgi:hypothetical protein
MIISQTPEEIKAAASLIAKCELKRIRMHQCSASLEAETESLTGPFDLSVSHNSTSGEIAANILPVQVQFHFESHDSSEEKILLFTVECAFDLDYQLEADFEPAPESVSAFKDGNAIFNSWPYAREYAQNVTTRMALKPPPLPLLRMVPQKHAVPDVADTPQQNVVEK